MYLATRSTSTWCVRIRLLYPFEVIIPSNCARATRETWKCTDWKPTQIPKPNVHEGLGISWPAQKTDMDKLKALAEEIKTKI